MVEMRSLYFTYAAIVKRGVKYQGSDLQQFGIF